MRCRLFLPILLASCLSGGTWMSMFFPNPCASINAATPRIDPRRDIVLCAPDECADQADRVAQICADNHFSAGQGVPVFPVAGVMCQCPCLGPAPSSP